jgi:NADH dehydrogenase/NADH:ubiquinone oxidoreductase subunit G
VGAAQDPAIDVMDAVGTNIRLDARMREVMRRCRASTRT